MIAMRLLFICVILYLCYVTNADPSPDVDLKFYEDTETNKTLLTEIHNAILNFKPIHLKLFNADIPDNEFELKDPKLNKVEKKIYNKIKYKLNTMLLKYKDYALDNGVAKIEAIPNYMTREFNIKKDDLPPITNVIKTFSDKVRHHFNAIKKEKCSSDIDKEFLLLDTVEKFNGFLYNEQLNLFNDAIFKANVNVSKEKVTSIMNRLYQEHIDNRRDDMEFLCLKLDICRPFLGFSDYMGDFIRELLKLSDAKLSNFLMRLSIPIKDKSEFFHSLLGNNTALKIGLRLEDLMYRDITTMRQICDILRSFLAERFKLVRNEDEDSNLKLKALRILVDIVDKSFDIDGDEVVAVRFGTTLNSISEWASGKRSDIQTILRTFVEHVVGIMKFNLNDEALDEIKVLIDVLINNEVNNNEVYSYIFKYGSKFVRGEDVSSNLELILG